MAHEIQQRREVASGREPNGGGGGITKSLQKKNNQREGLNELRKKINKTNFPGDPARKRQKDGNRERG